MTPSRPQANVPELLRTSRDRCVSQHGLEMRTSNPVLRLQQAEVSGRRERFLERIGGLGSELDRASLLPNKGGFCLLVSDADRIVVEAYVPDNYETDFGRFGIAIGGVWDERVAGTNGIDMALRSDRVLTVNGQDHYHNCFHAFACSSAPLNDAQNNVIGSVTLVGSAKRRSEEIAWGEQVLRVAGARFQAQLFRRFHSTRITARLTSLSPDRRARFETIVACDESGVILSSLPLWRTSGLPPEHRNLQGCHLSDLRVLISTRN